MMRYFKEQQQFDQWWIYAIVIGNSVGMTAFFSYIIYAQIYLNEPWGDQPMSDMMLIIVGLVIIVICFVITWGLFIAKMETQIKDRAIYYRFQPFLWKWKKITADQVESYEIKKINKFGLRKKGYRRSFAFGTTLIVKGDFGLQLTLKTGKKILFSTKKANELESFMKKIMNNQVDYG